MEIESEGIQFVVVGVLLIFCCVVLCCVREMSAGSHLSP